MAAALSVLGEQQQQQQQLLLLLPPPTTYYILHTTYNIQHTTYNIQHATYNNIQYHAAIVGWDVFGMEETVRPVTMSDDPRFYIMMLSMDGYYHAKLTWATISRRLSVTLAIDDPK